MMRRYKGKLYYVGSNDYMDITDFIIRPDGIGFSLTSVSELGHWKADSGKTALLQPDGSYRAPSVQASAQGTYASILWDIVFWVGEECGETLGVTGRVREGTNEGSFEGELEAYKTGA